MLVSLPILPLPEPPADGNLGVLPPSQVAEQIPDSEEQNSAVSAPAPVATHTRTIGIIHPPTDIRNICDKTVQFVAKNGQEFERRIISENAGNPKFNFLSASDPYHAYYLHRLAEFRSQNQPNSQQPSLSIDNLSISDSTTSAMLIDGNGVAPKPDPSAQFRPVRRVLEPPEAEQYTVRLPEGITGEELDIIKLTSQFVARNGKSFLTGLTSREMNNPQFHFLKPTHSMFMFFTALCDAYSKVLMPPKGLTEKLKKSVVDRTTVLERCLHRLEWERSQEQARQKAEDEIEQERMQMAMIDWHDFVVVETIDFADDEDEDLPLPMTLEEVIRRSKVSASEEQEIPEPEKEVEMDMDEAEVQFIQEGQAAEIEEKNELKPSLSEKPESPMRIVKHWKRPEERISAEKDPTNFVVSPITGELILINEMSEHMRISLIDPKFKEQKERMFAKIRETTLAQDDEISRNIMGLARTRPDIFGTTEEEVSNAVKAEIEKKKEEQPKQVIWDGHSGSIGRTANQAMSQTFIMSEDPNQNQTQTQTLNGIIDPRILLPATPVRPTMPSIRSLPLPPGLPLNLQRPPPPPQATTMVQFATPRPPPPPPLLSMVRPLQQQPGFMIRPPIPGSAPVNIPVPPPPGSHFTHMSGVPHPFVQFPPPPSVMPPMPNGVPPPPLPEEAPPPLPEEPEPKRLKADDSFLVPEDQFLSQHPGPVRISVSVPNVDEGNLKGQVVEITVPSLSETVANLKEKLAGEVQLPANKQKLSGKAGFLKDNLSLAHYNIGVGDTLSLSLRERGGRKR